MKRKLIYIFIHLIITISLILVFYCSNDSIIETRTFYLYGSSTDISIQCKKPDITLLNFNSAKWDYNPYVSMYKIYYNSFDGYCSSGNFCINSNYVVEEPCCYQCYPHVEQTTCTTYNIPVSSLTTLGSIVPFTTNSNWYHVQCFSVQVEPICGSFTGEAAFKSFWSSTE